MTDLTFVMLYCTPTLMHTHTSLSHTLNQSVTHPGGGHVDFTYTDMETESSTHCSVTDGCVTPTTVVHFEGLGEQLFVRGDLGDEKA